MRQDKPALIWMALSMALAYVLLFAAVGWATIFDWQGDESTLWGTAGNWDQGSVPGVNDTANLDNTAAANCSLNVIVSVKEIDIINTCTMNLLTNPALACTVSGSFLIDAASVDDTIKLKNIIVLYGGAGSKMAFETGPTYQITATTLQLNCDSLINRTGALLTVLKINKTSSLRLVINGSFRATQLTLGIDTTQFLTGAAGYIWVYPTAATDFTTAPTTVINTGSTDFAYYPQSDGTYTYPALTTIGTGSIVIQDSRSAAQASLITVNLGGNISSGHNVQINKSGTGKFLFNTQSYNLSCNWANEGYIQIDNYNATDTMWANLGSSDISYKYFYINHSDGDGILKVNPGSSTLNCGQDWRMTKSSVIWTTGTETITLNAASSVSTSKLLYFGPHIIYNLIQNSGTKSARFMDSLRCNSFVKSSGSGYTKFTGPSVVTGLFSFTSTGVDTCCGAVFKVYATGFGTTQGTGNIFLGTSNLLGAQAWSNTLIIDTIPVTWIPKGTYNVIVKNSDSNRDTTQIRVLIPSITGQTP